MAEVGSNPVPFEVLGDETDTQRIGLELAIFAFDDPMLPLDVVPRRFDLKTLDELNGPGGGAFKIMRSDEKLTETPNLLDYRNVCKVYLDRKIVGGFLIQALKADFVNRDEKAGEFWEVSGGGLREWTHDAVVEPYGGVRSDSQSERVFSFASEQGDWYDPDDWDVPVIIQQYDLDPNPNPFGTAPADWPDAPLANWIWGVDNDDETNPAPPGINYFRYEFTIAEIIGTKSYSVFGAAKDEFDFYLDGQKIIESRDLDGYAHTWRADLQIAPGNHILAARVRASGAGKAGLIAALFRAGDAAAETPAELLAVTDTTWVVNSYPDPAPGWTPGEIMLTLLAEAEDRGVRFPEFLTPTFTSFVDSDGATWPSPLDWSFDIGTEYFDVIAKLEELVCDVWIDPETLELNMYAERGAHRDVQSAAVQPVKFEIGRNVVRAEENGTSDIKNALLMSTNDGWQSVADGLSGSIAKYGRIEGHIQTGASSAVSGDLALSVFKSRAEPETSATYDIIDVDDARPHTDFFVGDWVLAPSSESETELASRHIMSIAISEDQKTSKPIFAIEFDTIFQDLATRYERWLKTTGDGTLGGTLANVSTGGGGGSGSPSSQNTQTGPMGLQGIAGPVGINWEGPWSSLTDYSYPDAVSYGGSSYLAVDDTTGDAPSEASPFWNLIARVGNNGLNGADGAGLVIIGTLDSTDDLPGSGSPGDAYMIDGDLYIWSSLISDWENVGPLTGGGGGGGGGYAAGNFVKTTPSLIPMGQYLGMFDFNAAEVSQVLQITADHRCRVRFYASVAQRDADAPRAASQDPWGNHGVLLDVDLTPGILSIVLSPAPSVFNIAGFPGSIPVTITNTDPVATTTITVTALTKGLPGAALGGTDVADYVKTTASLANGASENSLFTLSSAEMHQALVVTADKACRIRFYASTSQRTDDAVRPIGTDPTGNHGLLLEVVLTSGHLTYVAAPAASLFASSGFGPVPVTITNMSGSTGTVTATLTAKGV